MPNAIPYAPRVGDEFTYVSERGNPFASGKVAVRVIDVRYGWVQYLILNDASEPIFGGESIARSSCIMATFTGVYEPTKDSLNAAALELSLMDYRAYVRDQAALEQVARDEAIARTHREGEAAEIASVEERRHEPPV